MSNSKIKTEPVVAGEVQPKVEPLMSLDKIVAWSPSADILRDWLRDGAQALVRLIEAGKLPWQGSMPTDEIADPVAALLNLLRRRGFKDAQLHWEDPVLIWIGSFYIGIDQAVDLVDYMQRNNLTAENVSKARLRRLSLESR